MSELLDTVTEGRSEDIPGLLKPLGVQERKAELAGLKKLRAELRADRLPRNWQKRQLTGHALLVAGAGCHTGAAAAVSWIAARDLRGWGRLPHEELLDVLSDREPGWLGDVAHRLADRTATAESDYPLIAALVGLAGCPMPMSDPFVRGWAEAKSSRPDRLEAMREDPLAQPMLLRLFQTAELPGSFSRPYPGMTFPWASVLAVLSREGVLGRGPLVDSATARLLRGGTPRDLSFCWALLRHLELTTEEDAAHTSDWIAMTSDGPAPVAGQAQEVLARLDAAGALATRSLADMSRSALFRPEKKLVRAQLVLLGKALRRDPGSAPELLPVIAEAFGHDDTGVQERALKLVGRYLSGVDAGRRPELASCAGLLSPVHRPAAERIFGELPAEALSGPQEEMLPPVPLQVRLAPAPSTLAELVEEVVALISARTVSHGRTAFERTLDGLVRYIHRDSTALTDALRDAMKDRWWMEESPSQHRQSWFVNDHMGLELVVASAFRAVRVRTLWDAKSYQPHASSCAHSLLAGVVTARLREIAWHVQTKPLPFLLATPSWETGAIDPDVLVERLREYQRVCATPAAVDFGQALLRVRRTASPETVRAAAALGTPEGDRLADWLRSESLSAAAGTASGSARELPPALRWVADPAATTAHCGHWYSEVAAGWPAVLPEDRETLAVLLLPALASAVANDVRSDVWWLPQLAEAGGSPGPALHRALAYGLGSRHPGDRLSAVDALLVLAAQGRLDGPSVGREVAGLLAAGRLKTNRLTDSFRTAAATGAHTTVWSVLSGALPALLAEATPRHGLGDILSVTADCAERSGATAGIPGLEAMAGRGGSSRLSAQATRLLVALGQDGVHVTPKH